MRLVLPQIEAVTCQWHALQERKSESSPGLWLWLQLSSWRTTTEVVITAVDTFPSPSPSSLFLLSFPHLSRLIAALQTIRGPCCKSPNNCLPPVRFVTFRCPDCPLLCKDVPRKSSQGYRLGMYGHCACELITHLYVCFSKWRVSLNVNSSEGTFAQCK